MTNLNANQKFSSVSMRILSIALVIYVMSYAQAWAGSSGTWANGSAGSGSWTLSDSGELTITGTGAMPEYHGHAPWATSINSITSVNISNGGVCNNVKWDGCYQQGQIYWNCGNPKNWTGGQILKYEKSGDHYNIYDSDNNLVAKYASMNDFGTTNEFKRTHYTLDLALDHIKKKRPGETLNDITFTFK